MTASLPTLFWHQRVYGSSLLCRDIAIRFFLTRTEEEEEELRILLVGFKCQLDLTWMQKVHYYKKAPKLVSSQHLENLKISRYELSKCGQRSNGWWKMCECLHSERFMVWHMSSIKAQWGWWILRWLITSLIWWGPLSARRRGAPLRANVESVFNPRLTRPSMELPIIWFEGLNSFGRSINSLNKTLCSPEDLI